MHLELFLNLILLLFALYAVYLDLRMRYVLAQNAKKVYLEYKTSRKCTKKEKELLKKLYYIDLKDDTICSIEFPDLTFHDMSRFIFLNQALAHCGPSFYNKIRDIKRINFVYHKRKLCILESEDTNGEIITLEDEIKLKNELFEKEVEEENKEYGNKENKPWFYGAKISFFSLFLTIVFLISLNYLDISIAAKLYFIIYFIAFIFYLKEKKRSFYQLRQHNTFIATFAFLNLVILGIFLSDYTDIKITLNHYLNKSKSQYINFQRDIDSESIKVGSMLYMAGYRLCATKRCNRFIVLNKNYKFKEDSLITPILLNSNNIFFKKVENKKLKYLKTYIRKMYSNFNLFPKYYSLKDYKKILSYLEKFKKYNLNSSDKLINLINEIVQKNIFVFPDSSKVFKIYKNAVISFKKELFLLERNRHRAMIINEFKKAKTIFILNNYEYINYKHSYPYYNYNTYLYNFEISKRMNDIHAVVESVEKKGTQKYIKIFTGISDNYFKDNLYSFLIMSLNILILLFNISSLIYFKRIKE